MIRQDSPEQLRLFIAVAVPDGVKDRLEDAQRDLRRGLPDGAVRWARRDQFHLTLKFLGDVEAGRVEAMLKSMEICGRHAPLPLRAQGIGFFPARRAPRVVWAGVEDAGGDLERVQSTVETAARGFTSEAPEEWFSGHVTLGRVKNLARPEAEKLMRAAGAFESIVFGEWVAEEIEVVRSQLAPQGAVYTLVGRVPLKGRGP